MLRRRAANLVPGGRGNHGPQTAGRPRFHFEVLLPLPSLNDNDSRFAEPTFAETLV